MKNDSTYKKLKSLLLEKNKYIVETSPDNDNYEIKLDKIASILKETNAILLFKPLNNDRINIEYANKLRQLSSIFDRLFIIKSRLDIVKYTNADGIVLDKNSIKIEDIIKFIEPENYLGYEILEESETLQNYNNFDFIISNSNINKYKIAYSKENIININ